MKITKVEASLVTSLGAKAVLLTIGDETFILTPEEYEESVLEWREALNLAGKQRASWTT